MEYGFGLSSEFIGYIPIAVPINIDKGRNVILHDVPYCNLKP